MGDAGTFKLTFDINHYVAHATIINQMANSGQAKNSQMVKKILKELCEDANVKGIRGLAKYIGETEGRLYGWIRNGNITDTGAILTKFPKINIEWLKTGKGKKSAPAVLPKTEETQTEFATAKQSKDIDERLARLDRANFISACPGLFADFFHFIGDNYGEDQEAVAAFLDELARTNEKYQAWRAEKKQRFINKVQTTDK